MAENSQDLIRFFKVKEFNNGLLTRVSLPTGDDIRKINCAEKGVPLLPLDFINYCYVEGNIARGAVGVYFENTESAQWHVDNAEAILLNRLLAESIIYGPPKVDIRGLLLLEGEHNENRLCFYVKMTKCERDFIIHLADGESEYCIWYDDECIYAFLNPTEVGPLS